MIEYLENGPGSRSWVMERLLVLREDPGWAERWECQELVGWLNSVVQRRARKLGLGAALADEIAQDAMTPVIRSLASSRVSLSKAINPAAVLERITARAVAESRHRVKMCGLSGVAPNGSNWHTRYPRQVGGDAAERIFDQLPVPASDAGREVPDAADCVAGWVASQVKVTLIERGVDGLVYVLDRLVGGVSRSTLLRGANSSLNADPAMRHLGFDPPAASAFGVWLLGRHDPCHNAPSLLDSALLGQPADELSVERWRQDGLRFEFVRERTADDEQGAASDERCSA